MQSNAISNEKKIVYLNLDQIIKNSIPGNFILKELRSQNKDNIEKFKLKENDLRNQEQDIIKKKNILSKDEFDEKVFAFNEKMKMYNKEREQTFLKFEEDKKKK